MKKKILIAVGALFALVGGAAAAELATTQTITDTITVPYTIAGQTGQVVVSHDLEVPIQTVTQTVTVTTTAPPPPPPTTTTTTTTPPPPPPSGETVFSADLETADYSQFDYPFDGGQHNPQNNGDGVVSISTDYNHTQGGGYSLKESAPTEGSVTRVFEMPRRADGQWSWPDEELVFSAWYLIPNQINVGGNWNVFQFKSKEIGGQGRNEPFFSLNMFSTSTGYRLRVYHKPDGTNTNGHYLTELAQPRAQVGQWFQIKAQLVQSPLGSHIGRIRVWLCTTDCTLVVDESGVDTRYAGSSTQNWSVNNYGTNLTRPAVIYVDDLRVARP